MLLRANVVTERKGEGSGVFFLHRALAVTTATQLRHRIYGRDVQMRPAAHAGPVKTFSQDHIKTRVQSSDMIQQQNDILHKLTRRQPTKESLNLSTRVERGWWDVSKPPFLFQVQVHPFLHRPDPIPYGPWSLRPCSRSMVSVLSHWIHG